MTTIERDTAQQDYWCSHCLELGIPDPTIIRGQDFMKVRTRRSVPGFKSKLRFFCLDCWREEEVFESL